MTAPPTIGSLCTGYGGLDLAATAVTGGRVVWVSDTDPSASRILAHHHPEIPNIGDLTTATPDPTDILTAGFPCQPVSVAGSRNGTDDERWLWPHIIRIVDTMPRPPLLMLENVPGLTSVNDGAAWADILTDLTARGYNVAHRIVAASDVGACHRRNRLFILAEHPTNPQRIAPAINDANHNREPGGPNRVHDSDTLLPTPMADERANGSTMIDEIREHYRGNHRLNIPGRKGHIQRNLALIAALLPTPMADERDQSAAMIDEIREHYRGNHRLNLPGRKGTTQRTLSRVADALLTETAPTIGGTFGDFTEAVLRHAAVLDRDPPAPTRNGRLTPEFVEWMMMLDTGHVTNPDHGLTRRQQLHVLGNGVVPPQASAAFGLLAANPPLPFT